MLISEPMPFVKAFIEKMDLGIKEHYPEKSMSRTQKACLGFLIMAVLITNSVCWAKFERASLGKYSLAGLSWMFRNSRIPWDLLLIISTMVILKQLGITEGNLGIDDTDKKRSKSTKKIAKVHKIKDKPSGGYIMGQSIVFLVLITSKITIPVGFAFFMPDPALKAWKKQDEKLKKKGILKSRRPVEPKRNENYPTIPELALNLLEQFKKNHPDIKIKCIFADALYGTAKFLDGASKIFGGIQVISQIKATQNVRFRNNEISVEKYFESHAGTEQIIKVRGGKGIRVIVGSARLYVCSHGKKRFVIALKYEGEEEYRYIVASHLGWKTMDIVETYTLRWLVEVFFEDWKAHEGFGKLTKQRGEEGSSRSLILSLLVDHSLFFHPDQLTFLENNLPACTVGSLIRKIQVECILKIVQDVIEDENPQEKLNELSKVLKEEVIRLEPSSKHMNGRRLGRFDPAESLKYRNAA